MIKILSYNVMCFDFKDHLPDKPNEILAYIANSEADIVCLQEFIISRTDDFLTLPKIRKALNMYPYHYNLPLIRYKKYSVGLAVFSKYPILKSWKVRYNSAFNGSSVHEINVRGKKVMVVNNHLESFKLTMDDRSKYADFIKNMNTETFDGFRETVQRKLGAAFRIRAEQAEIVANEIAGLQGRYVIVCGDFNDTPVSYAHRVIQGNSLIDAYTESGRGISISYNQNFFWFRIDHILHSTNMKSYNTTIEKIALSDHYPIWTYLEMNK
ncbi:MAG: endonuclease/exonuclease/phosphatase family protein [Tannerella sp.]|jgi:endonuclease/exonuclease/phosphatase family metal-dependent hydrolase|nr:endonuclease/exonuclease/phosphatase family protein [Tannerella sp.]